MYYFFARPISTAELVKASQDDNKLTVLVLRRSQRELFAEGGRREFCEFPSWPTTATQALG